MAKQSDRYIRGFREVCNRRFHVWLHRVICIGLRARYQTDYPVRGKFKACAILLSVRNYGRFILRCETREELLGAFSTTGFFLFIQDLFEKVNAISSWKA